MPISDKKPLIKWVVIAGLALVVLIVAISAYSTINGARSGAISRENGLIAQYQDNKNELSKNILTINESLGIADRQSEVLNGILSDAVQGRYDGDLQPGTGGQLFSAISEAYPDLTATAETYANVQQVISAERQGFANKQSKLLSMVEQYKNWINADLYRSWILDTFVGGAPTDFLTIEENGQTFTGEAALKKIGTPITTSETEKIYGSGTQEPIIKPAE